MEGPGVEGSGMEEPGVEGSGPEERDAEEMVMFLERDQLVADRRHPRGPARLSGRAKAALWGLRVFVLIVGAMVIYTFVAQLS